MIDTVLDQASFDISFYLTNEIYMNMFSPELRERIVELNDNMEKISAEIASIVNTPVIISSPNICLLNGMDVTVGNSVMDTRFIKRDPGVTQPKPECIYIVQAQAMNLSLYGAAYKAKYYWEDVFSPFGEMYIDVKNTRFETTEQAKDLLDKLIECRVAARLAVLKSL